MKEAQEPKMWMVWHKYGRYGEWETRGFKYDREDDAHGNARVVQEANPWDKVIVLPVGVDPPPPEPFEPGPPKIIGI